MGDKALSWGVKDAKRGAGTLKIIRNGTRQVSSSREAIKGAALAPQHLSTRNTLFSETGTIVICPPESVLKIVIELLLAVKQKQA